MSSQNAVAIRNDVVQVDVPSFAYSIVRHDLRSIVGVPNEYSAGNVRQHATLPVAVNGRDVDVIIVKRYVKYTKGDGTEGNKWEYAMLQHDRRGNGEMTVPFGAKQDITRTLAGVIAAGYKGGKDVMSAGKKWQQAMEHAKSVLK